LTTHNHPHQRSSPLARPHHPLRQHAHDRPRQHHRDRRTPRHPNRPQHRHHIPRLGHQRLPHRLRRPTPPRRTPRRPPRTPSRLHHRPHPVHPRLPALRHRHHPHTTDRRPIPPRNRRRLNLRRQPRHAGHPLPRTPPP